MLTTNCEVKRLNDLLKRELGEAPNGDARFKWMWSEDIRRYMVDLENPDWVCACGTSVRVHAAGCLEIVTMRPKVERRKLYPMLTNQWLIAYWKPPKPREQWERVFGNTAVYPSRGEYWAVEYNGPIVKDGFKKFLSMKPHCLPNRRITEAFIGAFRSEMEKSVAAKAAEFEAEMHRKERAAREENREHILDIMGPFPQGITGKRGHGVSLPDPEQQASGDAAPAWIQ